MRCPVGGTVLDPFAGTGTTVVAARQTGRSAVGIEIEARYCAVAGNRLERAASAASTSATTAGTLTRAAQR